MNQKLSKALLVCGVGWLLYNLGQLLTLHSEWAYFRTPLGVGDLMKTTASVVLAITGALGINLPKKGGDR